MIVVAEKFNLYPYYREGGLCWEWLLQNWEWTTVIRLIILVDNPASCVFFQQKNVGMDGPLIDSEGYPRADIDVYSVRHSRHRIICKCHKSSRKHFVAFLHVQPARISSVWICVYKKKNMMYIVFVFVRASSAHSDLKIISEK